MIQNNNNHSYTKKNEEIEVCALQRKRDDSILLPKRRGKIGILINNFDSQYCGHITEYASKYLLKRGYRTVVQSNANTKFGEKEAWRSLCDCDCDGYIIHPAKLSSRELAQQMELYPKSVLINHYLPSHREKCVCLDNMRGGWLAGEYLLKMGHTRIAMVTGPKKFFDVRKRAAGFIRALKDSTLSKNPSSIIHGDFTIDGGAAALRTIVESNKKVTAIFFHNDHMALGALTQCKAMGIEVPNDLSIMGYDNELLCRHSLPRLTSIHQPFAEIGEAAAQLILQLIGDDPSGNGGMSASYVFPPELVVRESIQKLEAARYSSLLTKREIECLEWTSIGMTAREISVVLEVTESTISFHIKNVIEKLGAKNRSHAVAIALKKGVISGRFKEQPSDCELG